LRGRQQQLAVIFTQLVEQLRHAAQESPLFGRVIGGHLGFGDSARQVRQRRRRFAVVKDLEQRDLERPRKLFDGLDRRHRVTIFHSGDVTPQQAGTLLDLAL